MKTPLKRRRLVIGIILGIFIPGIFSLGWWLYDRHTVSPLTPVAIVDGKIFGDISSSGFLLFKESMLFQYDWLGNKKAEYVMPALDQSVPDPFGKTGWNHDQDMWASPDFLKMCAGDAQWGDGLGHINRNRALPWSGQLARFSPTGECVGALSYQKNSLLIKVWCNSKLLRQTSLQIDLHGRLTGRQVVDLLVADDGVVLLYLPSADTSLTPEPLLVVGRKTKDSEQLQTIYRTLIDQYLQAQPAVLPVDTKYWFRYIDGLSAISPNLRYIFVMKTLILARDPHSPYFPVAPKIGKEMLAIYEYPGRMRARLVTNSFIGDVDVKTEIPFPNHKHIIAWKTGSPVYLSPDGYSVLIKNIDEPFNWGIMRIGEKK